MLSSKVKSWNVENKEIDIRKQNNENKVNKKAKKGKENKNRKKKTAHTISLKTVLTLTIISLVVVSVIITSVVSIILNARSNQKTVNQFLSGYVKSVETIMENFIVLQKTKVLSVTNELTLKSAESSGSIKDQILEKFCEQNHFENAGFISKDGKASFYDGKTENIGEQSFYLEYMRNRERGVCVLSNPIIRKDDQNPGTKLAYFALMTPIISNGQDMNLLVYMNYSVLNDTIQKIQFSKSGKTFMVDDKGYTIADKDIQYVYERENAFEEAKNDPKRIPYKNIVEKMIAGETGNGTYLSSGKTKLVYYTPVENTDWSIAISAYEQDFNDGVNMTKLWMIIIAGLLFVVSFIFGLNIAKRISKPIVEVANGLARFSQGNLHETITLKTKTTEVASLLASFRKSTDILQLYISDISSHLENVANGDLHLDITQEYVGDFIGLKTSLEKIIASLNIMMYNINKTSSEVLVGADQLSNSAQALSAGATEQSGAVEQLTNAISEINDQTINNAENAKNANTISQATAEKILHGKEQMENMVAAMRDIKDTSAKIEKIIKDIDDLAFQTNILALNAAVEAARAGEAGKGFAVVADEVRNLASKSAQAAQRTADLIQNSLQAVKKGTKIADETANSLVEVVDNAAEASKMIHEISNVSVSQANSLSLVSKNAEQITSVIQTNSATAEESAAASAELAVQAQHLRELVEQFKLKETIGDENTGDLSENKELNLKINNENEFSKQRIQTKY